MDRSPSRRSSLMPGLCSKKPIEWEDRAFSKLMEKIKV